MATTIAEEIHGDLNGVVPRFPVNDPQKVEQIRRQLGLEPLYREDR
jgi:hypothetical protein